MNTSGDVWSPAAAGHHKAGSVGALIAYVQQQPAPRTVAINDGSVKAPPLTADNDDDSDGLGFWKWQSMVNQIVAWGAAITLLALIGISIGIASLRLIP